MNNNKQFNKNNKQFNNKQFNKQFNKQNNKQNKKTRKKHQGQRQRHQQTKKTYEPFEHKVEELFKQDNIDITSANYNLEKEVIKDLKKAVSVSNITPHEDFYTYVNERWIQNTNVENTKQGYIVQIDDFRLIQDQVYRQLISILDEYVKDSTHNTKMDKCIKNAYKSSRQFHTLNYIQQDAAQFVKTLDELMGMGREEKAEDFHTLWSVLAHFNKNEIVSWGAPFVWSINPDDKNPTIYTCNIESPQVSLLDIDIYFNDPSDNKEIKQYKKKNRIEYLAYLNALFEIVFGASHGFQLKDVYDCECSILNAMACDVIKYKDDDDTMYNIISREEALKQFGFDWTCFCKELGFRPTAIPSHFITSNVNYLLCGTKMLKDQWKQPEFKSKWRTYFIYIYIRQQTRWNEFGFLNYVDFFGKYQRGQESAVDLTIRPIFFMGFAFNTFLTNQYVERYKNQDTLDYVSMIAEDLKIVFRRIVMRNTWMLPKTKQTALEKLDHIQFQIGFPNQLSNDPCLDYSENDPWGNLAKMSHWRHQRAIQLVGKKVIDLPVIDWSQTPPKFISTQAYVVNAMYTPDNNSIYIPLGYIQKPFIDLDQMGIEYNLAHLGFTIAHELSHSLDDFGSKYNKYGQLEDWWSAHDKKEYLKIQQDIVKEYEIFAKRDNIQFDAWPSIGEDLADISGFEICQEYLRDFQQKNETILPIQALSFEMFYVYFALQSRQKISKKAILAQLKTNPHPLDKYRCNVPLSRSTIFRAIYNVKKHNNMWWGNSGTIWK